MRVLVVIVVVALVGVAAVAVHHHLRPDVGLTRDLVSAERLAEDTARRVARNPLQLMSPGPLTRHHRDVPELADCKACHGYTSAVQADKCLGCHEGVAERIETGVGHHGSNLLGDCAGCHVDHREPLIDFDPDAFQHDQALFALTGAHVEVACEACHVPPETPEGRRPRMGYIGLAHERCTDCHESPHAEGISTQDCESCHVTRGWGGSDLHFDHDTQSRFPLDVAHAALACDACHETQVFKPLGNDCASCHADIDGFIRGEVVVAGVLESWAPSPHAGLVTCRECHGIDTSGNDMAAFADACARCHTSHHAQLYLDRDAHLLGLIVEGRQRATSDDQRMLLDVVERVGSHNFVPAEQRVAGLLEELRR